MNESLIKDVSDTAFWIAHFRATESQRPDALFHDPLAGRLAADRGRELAAAMPMSNMIAWSVALRTRVVSDYIKFATELGVDTIVNLGAGLDTRPYWMDLQSSLCWIEADYPGLIDYKESRLADAMPRCRVERVRIDLANLAERRTLFSSVNARAKNLLILTEGLVPYLSNEQAASLADDLKALNRASYWIVDYFSPEAMKYRERKGMTRHMQNAPFKFAPSDWFGFFQTHGWQTIRMRYLADEGERLRRPMPAPALIKILMKIWMPFVPRERREALRKFAGYALLAPC